MAKKQVATFKPKEKKEPTKLVARVVYAERNERGGWSYRDRIIPVSELDAFATALKSGSR
ncbi:MAG: hypothetical protein N2561_00305 [Bacteroidetes bacterium]|nr:hypothetical protein [Rhodothermia bacterium]MCS7155962.1 hypothetical protein [Bacteroidota bacterium]MCX7905968.1 hypothetical protein [Bacteroidota bacterium]MDW8138065.1 hypothetical protein [Bacteroidota bacterium]MDW8285749.1 hypothetical protein [Bacteroidota bacterium]